MLNHDGVIIDLCCTSCEILPIKSKISDSDIPDEFVCSISESADIITDPVTVYCHETGRSTTESYDRVSILKRFAEGYRTDPGTAGVELFPEGGTFALIDNVNFRRTINDWIDQQQKNKVLSEKENDKNAKLKK